MFLNEYETEESITTTLSRSQPGPHGLSGPGFGQVDRAFLVTDSKNSFVSGRKYPRLVRIFVSFEGEHTLVLTGNDLDLPVAKRPTVKVRLDNLEQREQEVQVGAS